MTHDNNPGATMRTKRETLITTLEEAQRATGIAAAHLASGAPEAAQTELGRGRASIATALRKAERLGHGTGADADNDDERGRKGEQR